MQIKKLAIIVNPGAGQEDAVLNIFNEVFTNAKIDWDVFVTKKSGDAYKYAKEAITKNYEIVAVYGGDGTVREVASALVTTNTPMAIIPGGTANVFSIELGIPTDIHDACNLIIDKNSLIREVDVGKVNDSHFILRIGIGFEALMIHRAPKFLKRKIGVLAYFVSAIMALAEARHSTYKIIADGKSMEYTGSSCIIANSSNLGLMGLNIINQASIDDGVFDVIILRNLNLLRSLAKSWKDPINFIKYLSPFKHFQARKISVTLSPMQKIQCDGELLRDKKLEIEVIPKGLKVIIPK